MIAFILHLGTILIAGAMLAGAFCGVVALIIALAHQPKIEG